MAKRYHWVYIHRAPRWRITSQQRNAEQQRRRSREGERVGRLNLVEQRFEVAGQPEGRRQLDCHSNERQRHPATDDEPEDISWLRPERQTNADLARALR